MVYVRVLLCSELLNGGLLRLFSGVVDLVVCLVWFGDETDVFVMSLLIVRLIIVLGIFLCLPSGVSLNDSTVFHLSSFLLLVFSFLQSFILLHRDLPPLFFKGTLFILALIQRLIVSPSQFLFRP